MTGRTVIAWLTVALLALGAAFALGWQQHETRTDSALRAAERTSDSLRLALRTQVATVLRDTVVRDSLVTRWRRYVDTLQQTDTVQRVDTVNVPAVIEVADEIIGNFERMNRECSTVLLSCEQSAQAAIRRADMADARARMLDDAARSARRHVATERAICATSIAANFIQWRAYR